MSLYIKLRTAIKQNQWLYTGYKIVSSKELRQGFWDARTSLKTKKQMFRELSLLKHYWGCIPLHYFRYKLYAQNLSDEELKDFIPPYFFYVKYCGKIFKDIDNEYFDNKLNLYYEFKKKGISTVPVIAVFDSLSRLFYNPDSKKVIKEQELLSQLNDKEKFFLKPIDGQGGYGIIVLKCKDGVVTYNGNTISSIISLLGNATYVVQKGLIQRDDLMRINSSSVNTLRIVTKRIEGKYMVKACVMRIGRNGKDIDNSAQGGLSVQINVDNGHFYPTATAEHGGGVILNHPDSGFCFKGEVLSGWQEIKMQLEKYASLIPELPEIAWDVALTKDGVVIIELNTGYGIDHLQCCCGGMRRKLEVFPQ